MTTILNEISTLWSWVAGIVAGWGVTFTIVIAVLIYAHVRIAKLKKQVEQLINNTVTEHRDLSIRLRKLEK
jgi:hypothetical protein